MAQDSVQTQDMIQTTKLSAIQVALASLLELPLNDLAERVNNELMENEALEVDSGGPVLDNSTEGEADAEEGQADGEVEIPLAEPNRDPAFDDYRTIDDVPEPILSAAERKADPLDLAAADNESFYEELQHQIKDYPLSEHEKVVLDYLICSLDDDGYLHKDLLTIMDELELFNGVVTNEKELSHLLNVLQHFEPRGIGARTLQECLRLQLQDPQNHSPWREQALKVVDHCFKEFMSNRWEAVAERLKFSEEESEQVRHLLQRLNPRPGRAFGESADAMVPTVIPDFFVKVDDDGEVHISLSNEGIPDLYVSQSFKDTIDKYTKKKNKLSQREQDEYLYVCKKVDAAKGFISLLERRNQTMMAVMKSIVVLQRPFFDDDDETLLRPLKLQEIADHAGVKISTVSRTVNSKYVQTVHRVYPLKFFFSTQFVSKTGEQLSSREVRSVLQRIIENEDKEHPYTDAALVQKLKEEGFPVARRTVVKYRDQLDIPVAKLRKK